MRALALALATLAVAPASAGAHVALQWQRPALASAASYWGAAPPCAPHLDYSWSNGGANGAMAFREDCRVGVDPSLPWTWPTFCAMVAHEWGHLLGREHEPGTVMDADVPRPDLVPGCRRAYGRPAHAGRLVGPRGRRGHRRPARPDLKAALRALR